MPSIAVVMWLYYRYTPVISSRIRSAVRFAPIWLTVSAIVMFGAYEYIRSWRHYQGSEKSLTSFVLNRFVGYYATSFNNGALCLNERTPYEIPLPYYTLHALLGKSDYRQNTLGIQRYHRHRAVRAFHAFS